ncbi:hypothetical protein [Gordonia sp. FQ]|uniref:hypothetical protein n=1 Tax=Gordonia sp. FQ TaxID=3446634 RepID=UPI003F880058
MAFPSRKLARRAARARDLHGLATYRCPVGSGVHLGHQPMVVRRGQVSASAYTTGVHPHRRRGVSAGVRTRFTDCCPPEVLTAIGIEMSKALAVWHDEHGRGPTWREALGPFRDRPESPVARLFDVPEGRNPDSWKDQATRSLMETLRDRGWITFDGRPHSLRPGALGEIPAPR